MNPVWHFLNGVPVIPVARIGVTLVGDGLASAPALAFASETNTGWYLRAASNAVLSIAGTARLEQSGNVTRFASDGLLGWGSSTIPSAPDVILSRGAANRLDLASGDSFNVVAGAVTVAGAITSSTPTSGVGYATGAGGAVTQGAGSGKATAVALNTVCGQITMNNAALNAGAEVSFALANTAIAATDVVVVNHSSAGTAGAYLVGVAAVGSQTCTITVANLSGSNLSEAIVLNFVVIRGVAA